jgi:nitronate monooxygenase
MGQSVLVRSRGAERFDGPIVLAGGISDGTALWAARVLGADLGYMGTKFIATRESLATDEYRSALVESTLDDVTQTTLLTGLPTNMLRPWLESVTGEQAGDSFDHRRLLDPRDGWRHRSTHAKTGPPVTHCSSWSGPIV